jgi:hypothetical protein
MRQVNDCSYNKVIFLYEIFHIKKVDDENYNYMLFIVKKYTLFVTNINVFYI